MNETAFSEFFIKTFTIALSLDLAQAMDLQAHHRSHTAHHLAGNNFFFDNFRTKKFSKFSFL